MTDAFFHMDVLPLIAIDAICISFPFNIKHICRFNLIRLIYCLYMIFLNASVKVRLVFTQCG